MTKKTSLTRALILENPSVTTNRTLAKLLLNKYPLLFKDLEEARTYVRKVQNKVGEGSKTKLNEVFIKNLADIRKKLSIEVIEQEDKTPYKFTKYHNNALVISDLHYPYTDIDAVDLALEYGYKHSADCVIINGDLMDFTTISRFLSKPNEMKVGDALEGTRNILDYIKSALNVKVVFHYGNHDIRWEHYIINKAPELWGLAGTSLEEQLQLKDKGIDYVQDYRFMKFGNLNIMHGHHILKGVFAPVNAARGVFIKAKTSTLIGHVHKPSTHIEKDMNGKVMGCYSTGGLTTVNPTYNPVVSGHTQGFALVRKDPTTGEFEVDNKTIINYKVK